MNETDLKAICYAGQVNSQALAFGINEAKIGKRLKELDAFIEEYILAANCKPAFKGYRGYPSASCLSVNDVAVHGIPSDYVLKQHDLLTIDLGTEFDGWFADAARSTVVGEIDNTCQNPLYLSRRKLIDAAQAILDAELEVIRPGASLMDIAAAGQAVAARLNFNVIVELGGHRIGRAIHEDPLIPNSLNHNLTGLQKWRYEYELNKFKLEEDMMICLEPVITAGSPIIKTDEDNWTIRTVDGSDVAHVETCLRITKDGYEILS